MDEDHEWELSKENVQPLRQGRQMSFLAAALHSAPHEQAIREEQRAFEEELRAYTGDDPFDVWDRYIKWTEQYFPKGGHEGHLSKLIERCLQKFQADSSYINDSRFIRLWIKFASLSYTPVEVYTYMFDNGIGHKQAAFYVEWALSLEMDGNKKQADIVYTEGLNRLAEPRDLLLQKQKEFEYRLVRNIVLQNVNSEESEMEVGGTDEERTALSRLKGSGARHKVGTTRTGDVKLGSAGVFKNPKPQPVQQVPSKGLSIFLDKENAPVGQGPQVTHEWKSMPRRPVDNCENEKKPGIWTDARVRQRPGHVAPSAPSYQIHEDVEPVQATPQKTAFVNKQPLSSRKGDQQSDVLSGIRHPHVVHPSEGLPQYQKDKVYNGMTEFSFEELRAIKYWKRKKDKEEEAERLRVDAERRRQQEAMALQLREQGERIAMMESLLQAQLNGLSIQQLQSKFPQASHDPLQLPQQQHETIAPSSSAQKEQNLSKAGPSARQEIFSQKMEAAAESSVSSDFVTPTNQSGFCQKPVSSTVNLSRSSGSQRTPIFNDISVYQNKTSGGSSSSNSSLMRSFRNKDFPASSAPMNESSVSAHNNSSLSTELGKRSFAHSATPGSNESSISSKPLHGMTSPTVCTKEALEVVQGMFCTDLDQDNFAESDHEYEKPIAEMPAPFKICEDEAPLQKICEEEAPLQQPRSFQIHCDEQSVVPTSGKKEKARSFGLRKSFQPMEEGNCDFTIECQARDDLTIAPLDNFSMQARAASTPFSSSHIKFEPTQELHSEVTLNSCSTSTDAYGRGTATSMNNLSPITEGSEGSGSTEDTHSTKCTSQVSELGLSTRARTTLPRGCSIKEEMEEEEGDISMHDDQPLDATHHHLIDTSACVGLHDERTQDLLSASAGQAPRNPFDDKYKAEFLACLQPPLSRYPNYHSLQSELPEFSILAVIQLDEAVNEYLTIEKSIGEGGFAKVFLITKNYLDREDNDFFAMKVQKPPCYWEFYIACEMHRRLMALNAAMDVAPSLARIEDGYFYNDGSLLMTKYMENGTLLNLVNLYKGDRQLMANVEPFACLLTIELLHLIEQLHKCNFIHGDVKPDNFLFMNLPKLPESQNPHEVFGSELKLVCLTDFGQSIDLTMFPPGTTFKAKVVTTAFQCIEMRTDRPWTFQTDLFGLAGTIHVALFGSYMKVFMERGTWKTTSNFVRKWNVPLWKKLFHELLNIPSCDLMPNLTALRREFEEHMMSSLIQPYNAWVQSVSGKLIQEAALENTVA